jgi:hypothetical protein
MKIKKTIIYLHPIGMLIAGRYKSIKIHHACRGDGFAFKLFYQLIMFYVKEKYFLTSG